MPKMKPLQVLVDRDLARQLKAHAALKDQTIKQCLDGLIRSHLAQQEEEKNHGGTVQN